MTKMDYTAIPFDRTRETFEVTLTIPKAVVIKQLGQKTYYAPTEHYPPAMLTAAIVKGLARCLGDGLGAKTDEEKGAYIEKKIDAHLAGSFDIVERSSSAVTRMRDAYEHEQVGLGITLKAIEKSIRDTITRAYGAKEAARFDTFLKAHALELAKATGMEADDIEDALVAKYEGLAYDLEANRAKQANAAPDQAAALAALAALGIAPKAE